MNNNIARIHSFESFGSVDGPGIRFIVFFQGCHMRCLYCHNRDTWDLKAGTTIKLNELMKDVTSYKNYMKASGGGVTASGGEPLLQHEFIAKWFEACKNEGIHTCLDTNGYIKNPHGKIDKLIANTDLVLLDLKQLNPEKHLKLVGVPNDNTLQFARFLQDKNIKTWIRYVVVPGWTDDGDDAHLLGNFIKDMQNVERVDLLPYHSLGKFKWEQMHDKYQLDGVLAPTKSVLDNIKTIIENYGKPTFYSQ